MNITIFETEHFEGAFPVIRLFDVPGNEITIITSPQTYTRFEHLFGYDMKRFQWRTLKAKGRFKFFFSLWKAIKRSKADICYFNTISHNHLLFALVISMACKGRVVLTVHDINCLFESKRGNTLRSAIIHLGKRWLIRKTDVFNVVSETLVEHLAARTTKGISVIPGAVYEDRATPQAIEDELRIVIPGSIDGRRRDYEFVLTLARMMNEEGIPAELVLLGGYHDQFGEGIVAKAVALPPGTCRIIAYKTSVVDQEEFDRWMDHCHFVFIPSVVHTKICGDIPEIYGLTKSSGNIFDVIKHAKPFIVPRALTIPPGLESSCFKYDSAGEITSMLKSFLEHPSRYDAIQQEAEKNSQEFTMEKVRERNRNIFGQA